MTQGFPTIERAALSAAEHVIDVRLCADSAGRGQDEIPIAGDLQGGGVIPSD